MTLFALSSVLPPPFKILVIDNMCTYTILIINTLDGHSRWWRLCMFHCQSFIGPR